ncbi:MAG: MFS transporter [Solirubrobacteraceae bacterium]|nr:MFS transporter [Patulibacter sp.]
MTNPLTNAASAATSMRRRAASPSHQAMTLTIILACYLMVVLDVSIIITGLPQIREALHFSSEGLSWVQNAYTLTFGGLLLLGARAGDLLGRRRVFMTGIAIFTGASLLGGLADSSTWLLAARAVQGVGAAIAAPATLSLLLITFAEGPERTKAMSYYSITASAGGSIGLVLGGVLTTAISWRWGLFLNVPIGALLLWLSPRFLPETERSHGRFDLPGALLSTAGMSALVYGFVRAASEGWTERFTLVSFIAGVALLTMFVVNELQAEQPITPLRLFASRERSGAYVGRLLLVGGMFSSFFFITQYLQGVLGYSALTAGLAFLPMTLAMFLMVRVVPRFLPVIGSQRLMIGGLSLAIVGMAWLSGLSDATAYFPGLAVPMVLVGTGMGATMIPLTTAGIAGVAPRDAGAASGLVNVFQQMGGSLGLGILVTVFASATRHAAEHPVAGLSGALQARHELAHGVAMALTGSAVLMAAALAVVVLVIRAPKVELGEDLASQLEELEAEIAGERELVG